MKKQAHGLPLQAWRKELQEMGAGSQRAVGAVLANWEQWQNCNKEGRLTYRITQVLTEYVCVASYASITTSSEHPTNTNRKWICA